MNTSLPHIVAQLRMEEMRAQAERARRARDARDARDSDNERTSSAPRHTRARTWAARHWRRPAAAGAGAGTTAQPGEVPR